MKAKILMITCYPKLTVSNYIKKNGKTPIVPFGTSKAPISFVRKEFILFPAYEIR